MARIDSGSSASSSAASQAAAAAAAKQAAAAAVKKAAADAAKKAAADAAKRKDGFEKKHLGKLDKHHVGGKSADLQKLAAGKGTTSRNADGSTATSLEVTKKGTSTRQDLTTERNKFTGETKLKFESTATTQASKTNSRETKHTFEAATDLLGRTTSTQSKEVSLQKGHTTTVDSRATATDEYGNKKVTTGLSTAVEKNGVTATDGKSTTRGAFGTRQSVSEKKLETFKGTGTIEEMKKGDTLSSTSSKSTTGTDFALSHSREFADGTFTLKDSADWKKNSFNKQGSKEKSWQLKDAKTPDTGFTQQKTTGVQGATDKVKLAGDALGAAGLKKEWKGKEWDTAKLGELGDEKTHFVGTKRGTSGASSVSVGANGVDAKFKREASAGAYAQHNTSVEGSHGKASSQAGARLEAKAGVDAAGKLNLNGLDASAGARVGVSAEASLKGAVETKSVKFAGVDLKAGAEGTVKASAVAAAEARGSVKFTRNPPAAIIEGSAGASAVVKAEAEVKVSAGPFALRASGYGSAGAEAKASGVLGYDHGKLKIGGSLGAAVGLGLGGAVNVEVDVKQIGDMAKHAADQNGDGKLGLDDVSAGAKHLGHAAASAVSSAAKTARSWLPW